MLLLIQSESKVITMLECSLGILADNEEKNIGRLLKAVQEQKLKEVSMGHVQ